MKTSDWHSSMTTVDLPPAIPWRAVAKALGLSPKRVARLMADGQVGFLNGRPRTLLPQHIEQLIRCVEIGPAEQPEPDDLEALGLSPRSLAHHRRTA